MTKDSIKEIKGTHEEINKISTFHNRIGIEARDALETVPYFLKQAALFDAREEARARFNGGS